MFEDVFGPLDDILEENPNSDWDTGEVWDSGEKENIWRTAPAAVPGSVWTTHDSCDGCEEDEDCDCDCDECDDDCDDDERWYEPEPGEHEHDEEDGSEGDDLDNYDDDLYSIDDNDNDEASGSPSGIFDDIFG